MKQTKPNLNLSRLILLAILLITTTAAFAQNRGTVKGRILTSTNHPAENVTVTLQGTKTTTVTDEDGKFELRAPQGTYTLVVSHVGIESQQVTATIAAGQTTAISDVMLNVSSSALQQVDITGNRTNRFNVKKSNYVAKMPLANLENPQAYSTISSELIKEQVITNFNDALKNAPGIDKLWTSTGRGGDGAGYFSLRGFAVQPTMVNGLPGLTNGGLDVANIERIEVLKGPSGTLFGSSLVSYGGLINVVTKKPFDSFKIEIAYTAGSFGQNRLTADVNTPLDKDKKVLLRINAAYHDQNSFQDAGFRKNRFFAPTLSYKANDKLSFLLNAEILASEGTNPTMLFLDRAAVVKAKTIDELGYNPRRSFTSNNLTIKNPTTTIQGQMNYRFNNEWTSQTVLSRSIAKSDGYYSYLYETQAATGFPTTSSIFNRFINYQNATTTTTDIQQNFNGDFNIGKLRNRVVIGFDYLSRVAIDNGTGYAGVGTINMAGMETGILSKQNVDAKIAPLAVNNSNTEQGTYSVYASDVINFTPTLSAMLSLRADRFSNTGLTTASASRYTQNALSPKFGLVYQPIADKVSIFANYMNGFKNVTPIIVPGQTYVFKPSQANQWETGVKVNLFESKLAATVSYYDIKVNNVVRTIAPNIYAQNGENYSRGFEVDINANPIPGLNIVAGYSHNDSKVTKTNTVSEYLNRRPEEAGPKNMVNAWISYRIEQGKAKGLGFGFGGNYASENYILNRQTTGTFALPSYTVLNASVFYSVQSWSLNFKMDNVTNKQYYKGWSTIEAQTPRAVIASVAFKF